jgi:molybdate transport system substrate-binding protein
MRVRVLSGGAARGLVTILAPRFEAATGCEIDASFGAVGAMRDRLLSGSPADLLILTRALIEELSSAGHRIAGSVVDVGTVHTAIAVRERDRVPPIGDGPSLRAALLAADAIYFPDPTLATAGIHFARVLDRLGIHADPARRLESFPNGAAAMRALAAATSRRPIGCTQVTEIVDTAGVRLAGPLPKGFELATMYTAGVCERAAAPEQAGLLARLLAGDDAREVRTRCGFSPT